MGAKSFPSSVNKDFIQTVCRQVSDRAIYLASVDERATVFCRCDTQKTVPAASFIKYSVVDCHLMGSKVQSESEKAIGPLFDVPSKFCDHFVGCTCQGTLGVHQGLDIPNTA